MKDIRPDFKLSQFIDALKENKETDQEQSQIGEY